VSASPRRNEQRFGLTAPFLGFSFLVAWAVVRTPNSTIGCALLKAASKIGFHSYSIYLWHPALLYVFIYINRPEYSFLIFWTYVTGCIAVGVAMAHLVEVPYLALRERIVPFPESTFHLLPTPTGTAGADVPNACPPPSPAPGFANVSPDSPVV
jgi:peptidoglycan/LPS O-acetylase OafA/YrhL